MTLADLPAALVGIALITFSLIVLLAPGRAAGLLDQLADRINPER